MSELPKLEKILFDTKEYELISRNKKEHKFRKFEFVITEDSYKQQLVLWDKYKDNINLFVKDYPQYELEMWEIKMKQNKYYNSEKDWLHDLLFKVE
jgi:hypothetical protein